MIFDCNYIEYITYNVFFIVVSVVRFLFGVSAAVVCMFSERI